jgi:hypothetical protein
MLGPALFPISLSNKVFSTETVLPTLPYIFTRHERVVFFVADHLQIYNKALRLAEGFALSEILQDFNGRQHYLQERNRWIERLTARITEANVNGRWKVIGTDDIADAKCFRIFRNVMLAYYSVHNFRAEVDKAAHEYAIRRSERYALEEREGLSRGYLLEEIALSVRIHIFDGIDFEYYIGDQVVPMLNLYSGKYDFSPFDLAEMPPGDRKVRLYALDGGRGTDHWIEQTAFGRVRKQDLDASLVGDPS